jgi:ParB-like nuclease family protein
VANENQPAYQQVPAAGSSNVIKALKPFEAVIEHRALEELKVNPRNARSHSKKQVQKLAACINEFGFLVPIQVDENNTILAGHGRFEAARVLKMQNRARRGGAASHTGPQARLHACRQSSG